MKKKSVLTAFIFMFLFTAFSAVTVSAQQRATRVQLRDRVTATLTDGGTSIRFDIAGRQRTGIGWLDYTSPDIYIIIHWDNGNSVIGERSFNLNNNDARTVHMNFDNNSRATHLSVPTQAQIDAFHIVRGGDNWIPVSRLQQAAEIQRQRAAENERWERERAAEERRVADQRAAEQRAAAQRVQEQRIAAERAERDRVAAEERERAAVEERERAAATERRIVALIQSGEAAYNRGDYNRAITDFTQVIQLDPNNTHAYFWRGEANKKMRDFDWAIDDFTYLIRLNRNDSMAYVSRGEAYIYKNEPDRAIADLTEAIRLSPNYAMAYYFRANAYLMGKNDFNRHIADMTHVIRLEPNNTRAYFYRGASYMLSGDYDRAIADLETVLRVEPSNADARQFLEQARQNRNQQ